MNAIPASVEAALLEAGFSGTEIAVMKRILEFDAMTLRELALRTAKSTGVLDLAIKKLLQKNIIKKEVINDSAKFAMTSWDAVLRWMEEDDRRKRELVARRQQNFEAFLRTVEQDKKRPEIEYFEGITNFPNAYRKLLNCGKELLCYMPVFCSIEDHPLSDFMVEWFRIRRKQGVFSRVIAHNTPLGRRYQSRDPFEYRRSILIEEKDNPFTFEKIICGDTVACFNYIEKRACLLKYPELASMERAMFESLWRQATVKKESIAEAAASIAPGQLPSSLEPVIPNTVPFNVRTFSGLREFFLSRKSIAAFAAITLLSAAVTFGLYSYTEKLQFERMQETVQSIAATGALQFEAKDLDALQVENDWEKPEWRKVVKQLEQIRKINEDVVFAYIFRKMKNDPTKMEFVADSHSLNPYANIDADPANNVDANNDGKIEPEGPDKLQWPGQFYPEPIAEIFIAYEKKAPSVASQIYEDSFGRVLSGFAPIKDTNGRIAGIIGIDMKDTILQQRTTAVFRPTLYFIGLFLFFAFIRLAAFNKSLFVELWEGLKIKRVLMMLTTCSVIAFLITFGLYRYMLRLTIDEMGNRIMSIVATAAPEIDAADLEQLHAAEDMKKDAYQRVFEKLNQIKDSNSDLTYVYIFRPVDQKQLFEWVADTYANYYLPSKGPDVNEDGILDRADENIVPGMDLFVDDPTASLEALKHPVYEKQFYSDQWGTWISAYAPVKDAAGMTRGLLGADIDAADVYASLYQKFIPWLWFTGGLSGLMFLYLLFKKQLRVQ